MKPTPLPFPLALNIGTDIVHLPRITRLISRPGGYLTRFTRRILSEQEQRDFRTRFSLPPLDSPTCQLNKGKRIIITVTPDMARYLAGRFAAKEAGRKAARGGAKGVGWKDVVVRVAGDGAEGRPDVVLFDRGEDGGRGRVGRLSISHDGEYVVATVLAAG
ncbi:4'-phosphopantetheinyl transferase superfamily [Aspergillus falconensis]